MAHAGAASSTPYSVIQRQLISSDADGWCRDGPSGVKCVDQVRALLMLNANLLMILLQAGEKLRGQGRLRFLQQQQFVSRRSGLPQ